MEVVKVELQNQPLLKRASFSAKVWRLFLWLPSISPYERTLSRLVTACTVVQAVVKATSQSNGKGQNLTPWGSETLERISMKLGIYNRVAGMTTHANPCGAATTWVVWANT